MIDWGAFLVVALASLVATAVVVSLYSLGLRLRFLTRPDGATGEPVRPRIATVLSYLCFALSAAAVLFGIYLIVPALHA
ncbi:hypothetical protein N1031_01705 [Herbiconiux moechotypicola]|uniref:Uncharacterized protein n=1 Tax=Herbiconiux moechotypicola TaxID=637393 RepID=A0ABN3D774_9MICO|nr:hypothetical protein [Herbiconiux moechotypicola]MCS5728468.1 hypothetical protein [Herbiconiux moechotypicola]